MTEKEMNDAAKVERSLIDEDKQYEIDISKAYPEPSFLMEGAGIGTIVITFCQVCISRPR